MVRIMFKKKSKDFSVEKISTIIGADVVMTGKLETKETTRIEGMFKGDVMSESTLIIGTTGKVEGNIKAMNVLIAGSVTGNMNVTERIEASASGKIYGDIHAKSLFIDEKAVFQGQCTMNVPDSGDKQQG